jgi:hypothetical protein
MLQAPKPASMPRKLEPAAIGAGRESAARMGTGRAGPPAMPALRTYCRHCHGTTCDIAIAATAVAMVGGQPVSQLQPWRRRESSHPPFGTSTAAALHAPKSDLHIHENPLAGASNG